MIGLAQEILPPPVEIASSQRQSRHPLVGGIPYTYIYTLSDPITGEIRYVGKANEPKQRFSCHFAKSEKSHKSHWIMSLRKRGLRPVLEIIEEIMEPGDDAWQQAEIFWISTLRFYGFNLTNIHPGGSGASRIPISTRKKMSRFHRRPDQRLAASLRFKGKKLPKWVRKKISIGMRGKVFSKEHCLNISNGRSGVTSDKVKAINIGRRWSKKRRKEHSIALKGRRYKWKKNR